MKYRNIDENISDGLYAINLLEAREDDEIDLSIDMSKVNEYFQNAIEQVKSLKEGYEDPVKADNVERNILNNLDESLKRDFDFVIKSLETMKAENTPSNPDLVESHLREIRLETSSRKKRAFF